VLKLFKKKHAEVREKLAPFSPVHSWPVSPRRGRECGFLKGNRAGEGRSSVFNYFFTEDYEAFHNTDQRAERRALEAALRMGLPPATDEGGV